MWEVFANQSENFEISSTPFTVSSQKTNRSRNLQILYSKVYFWKKKNCFLGLVITNIDFLSHENSDFSKPQKIMPWIFKLYNQWDISKETLTLFLLWWCPSGQTNKIRCQLILTNDFHSKWLIIVMIKMRLKTEVVITLCSMGWNNFWGEFSSILKFIHLHFCDLLKIFILQ